MKSIALVKRWLQEKPWGWVAGVMIMGIPGVIYASYLLAYRNRVYPGVRVGQINLGNRSAAEARVLINQELTAQGKAILRLQWQDQEWELDLGAMDLDYDVDRTVTKALRMGRDDKRDQWRAWFEGVSIPMEWQINEEVLVAAVATVAAEIDKPVVPPAVMVEEEVKITAGEDGREVNRAQLIEAMVTSWGNLSFSPIVIAVEEKKSAVTEEQREQTRRRAEQLGRDKLTVRGEDQTWTLTNKELVSFLKFEGGWDEAKIASYAATLAGAVDRPAQNAAFRFESGRVNEFRPGRDGWKLDQADAAAKMKQAMGRLETESQQEEKIVLAIKKTPPQIATDQVNSFGIKELLGRGVSTYRGSIPSRIHNVNLSAQRISGTLVLPGETFSFNSSLGEVADTTGYQQAYVIRDGRTVLDDGGGVCQTSTTLFRAVMEAGLPIEERRAHSYRVGYYEQNAKPGLDATVFAPTTDFKFRNDTPAHILVQTIVSAPARTLTVEIYGTSDGRTGKVVNHQVWDQTPPPPDLYQDDSSIPAGQVKQVDWNAWGAKVKYDYIVKRGGATIYFKTFYQVYQPWQAVYLRGTAP